MVVSIFKLEFYYLNLKYFDQKNINICNSLCYELNIEYKDIKYITNI